MQVTIINPPALNDVAFVREGRCEQRLSSFQYSMIPISLYSIAALLKKNNFTIDVLECIGNPLNVSDLLKKLKVNKPSLIIISMSSGTYLNDIKIAGQIKQALPNVHLTAMGNHVSALSKESLDESALDSIVIGEPEFVSLKLALAIQNQKSFDAIESLCFKKNGHIVYNPRKNFIEDLDLLPFPAREMATNEKYFLPIINEPYTLIITSRGCPYECIFCTAFHYYGKKLRKRSPKNIIAEIKEIIKNQNIRNITMWSDTFTLNRKFVMDICQGLIDQKIKIKWWCNSRVDRVDLEMLYKMKESGCSGISYGVESGVQQILDDAKKGVKIKDTINAFKWSNKAGIETLAHVIFGLPGETKETIRKTTDFVIKLKPSYAQFYSAIPFPGTEFYKTAKDKNWLNTSDWSKFEINQTIVSTNKLSSQDLEKERKRAYRRFYLNPSFMVRQLLKLKSWSEFKIKAKQGKDFIQNWILS